VRKRRQMKKGRHVKRETKTGAMQSQVNECMESPESERDQEGWIVS
jgi:hypothetical protein